MADELKYKVSIETEAVEASDLISPAAIQALVELNKEIDKYRKELNDLKAVEKEQGELTQNQAIEQERLKGKLKETSTEYNRQQRELLKMETATKAVGGSYNDLVKQNAALSAAMRALPIGENTAELQKLQAQYNANNDRLKEFDKSMGNHQRNVGNYSSALDNLGGMLSGIPGPIGDIVRTFEQFNNVLKAAGVSTTVTTTKIQGFTVAENTATVATAAGTSATIADTSATVANAGAITVNTTAQIAQASAAQASARVIGFDTSATVANTVATTANTGATAANATAQGAQAASTTTAASATGTLTVAQRVLNTVMKANPILLIVGLIAALVSAFSSLQPVMDKIKLVTTAVSSAFQFLRDTVFRFITGEEQLQTTFAESIRLSVQLELATQRLREQRELLTVESAKGRQLIAQRQLDAKNEELSIEQRIKSLQEAIEIEKNTTAMRLELASQELMIERERVKQYKSSADELQALAEQEAAYIDLGTQSLVRQRELSEQLNSLKNRIRAEEKALIDAGNRDEQNAAKAFELATTQRRLALTAYRDAVRSDTESIADSIRKADEAYIQGLPDVQALDMDTSRDEAVLANAFAFGEQLAQQTIDQAIRLGDTLGALELQQAEELQQRKLYYMSLNYTAEEASQMALTDMAKRHTQEREDALINIEKSSAKTREDIAMSVANSVMTIGTSIFGKSKALAVAQAVIDTYAAANSALKSTPGGPVIKGLAVAAVIAKGLANVKTIMSTKIGSGAGGGSTGATGGNMTGMMVANGGFLMPRDLVTKGVGAMNLAASASPQQFAQEQTVNIDANVDQRGIAIAVRRGEQIIRSQQITFV